MSTGTLVAEHRTGLGVGVWVLGFACAISYMGVGLVDPILPAISRALDATPGQTELLFSSYLVVTAVVMFFSSWVSSRIGQRRTLILGLSLVVLFALACALSGNVQWVIGFRGGWGIGNALFVSTALAAIIGSAASSAQAIVIYEAALGAGMAFGPLLGGLLGDISWRGPFLGTAALMALALAGVAAVFSDRHSHGARRALPAPFMALVHPGFRTLLLATLFYNYAYFTMLGYAPFPLDHAATASGHDFSPLDLGLVFFGWGGLLALGSVLVAPRLARRFGVRPTIIVALAVLTGLLMALALWPDELSVQVVGTILGGGLVGVANTSMTEAAMEATDLPRDIASSSYSGVRFIGGAIGPTLAGPISTALGTSAPYGVAAAMVVVTIALLAGEQLRWRHRREEVGGELVGPASARC